MPAFCIDFAAFTAEYSSAIPTTCRNCLRLPDDFAYFRHIAGRVLVSGILLSNLKHGLGIACALLCASAMGSASEDSDSEKDRCSKAVLNASVLGSSTQFDASNGINKTTRSYSSQVATLSALAGVVEKLGRSLPPSLTHEPLPADSTLRIELNHKRFSGQFISGLTIDNNPVLWMSNQALLLRSSETYHKMIHDMAEFGGFYVAIGYDKVQHSETLVRFMDGLFAKVSVTTQSTADAPEVNTIVYLVPIEQMQALDHVLKGGGLSEWKFEPPNTQSRKSVARPAPAVASGTFRTSGGTYYWFRSDGSVQVVKRSGEVLNFPSSESIAHQPSYASHAAILARQGVAIQSQDPVDSLQAGLAHNETLIQNHLWANHLSATELGIARASIDQNFHAFVKADGKWANQDKSQQLKAALDKAGHIDALLPESLQWKSLLDVSLTRAPLLAGQAQLRVIRRFLLIKNPAGFAAQNPFGGRLQIVHDDCMHLQAAVAHLGPFALELEKQGLLLGGHLAFEYDPSTSYLERVVLEDDQIVSLSRPGTMIQLDEAATHWVTAELSNYRPPQQRFPSNESSDPSRSVPILFP
jgi:hypothetical protein